MIYLGFLVPYALPYHLALLFLLSACGQVSFSLRRQADQRQLMTGVTGVRAYPRLRHGRVVLERARWYVPAAEFPVPAAGETDGRLFRAPEPVAHQGRPATAGVRRVLGAVAGQPGRADQEGDLASRSLPHRLPVPAVRARPAQGDR